MPKFDKDFNISLEQYIIDSGLDVDADHPISKKNGIVGQQLKKENTETVADEDVVDLHIDDDIEEMDCSFVTKEQSENVKIQSQQWRLEAKNIVNNKPEGMPPLVPEKAKFKIDLNRLNRNNNRNRFHQNNGAPPIRDLRDLREKCSRNQNRAQKFYNNGRGYNNHYNNGPQHMDKRPYDRFTSRNNYNHHNNNSRNQMMDMFREFVTNLGANNDRHQNDRSFNKKFSLNSAGGSVIEASPSSVASIKEVRFNSDIIRHNPATASSYSATFPSVSASPANLMQPVAALVANPGSALITMAGGDVMPTLGNAIMGHIQAIQQNFGNKYDMQAQKEIADLQGRSMLYRSPVNGIGGGVVSFDGSGLEADVTPVSTALSMNQRFA